jgi:1-acyl-sn-glycerol-3-phosphate acyltransferase
MVIAAAALLAALGIAYLLTRPAPRLPLPVEILRRIAAIYLTVFKDFRIFHGEYIPDTGPLILVANHTAVYDPVCLQVACRHRMIRFMEAQEYYKVWGLRAIYRMCRVIPVNRTGNDTAGIRTALRELSNNGCVGIFPEGRISIDGQIHEAEKGVALLALLSNAVVVPGYFQGTRPFSGMVRDFLTLNHVTLHFGSPIHFDDLAGRHRDEVCREIALNRIMEAILKLQEQSLPDDAIVWGTRNARQLRRRSGFMKILIAYDGSTFADAAIDNLQRAGLPREVEAMVVCVAHKGWPAVKHESLDEEFDNSWSETISEAEAVVERARHRLQALFPNWKISGEALWGNPAKALLETAEVLHSDLLVVGSHGRSAAGRLLLGSVSSELIHHAPCSVRVVRQSKEEHSGPIRLLLATDGSTHSQAVLDHVASLLWPAATEVRVVAVLQALVPKMAASPALEGQTFATEHAFSVIQEADERERARLEGVVQAAADQLRRKGLTTSVAVIEGLPQEILIAEAARWKPDAIYAGSRGLGTVERLLLGSVSTAMVSHAPCAVEIVRQP